MHTHAEAVPPFGDGSECPGRVEGKNVTGHLRAVEEAFLPERLPLFRRLRAHAGAIGAAAIVSLLASYSHSRQPSEGDDQPEAVDARTLPAGEEYTWQEALRDDPTFLPRNYDAILETSFASNLLMLSLDSQTAAVLDGMEACYRHPRGLEIAYALLERAVYSSSIDSDRVLRALALDNGRAVPAKKRERLFARLLVDAPTRAAEFPGVYLDEFPPGTLEKLLENEHAVQPFLRRAGMHPERRFPESMLEPLMRRAPLGLVEYLEESVDAPAYQEIGLRVLEKMLDERISVLSGRGHTGTMEGLAQSLLSRAQTFERSPVLFPALRKAARLDAASAVRFAAEYAYLPDADRITDEAIATLRRSDRRSLLGSIRIVRTRPGGKELMEELLREFASKEPNLVLSLLSNYQNEWYAADILREAAPLDASRAIQMAKEIREFPEADAILVPTLDRLLEEEPEDILMWRDKVAGLAYELHYLEEALLRTPDYALRISRKDMANSARALRSALDESRCPEVRRLLEYADRISEDPPANYGSYDSIQTSRMIAVFGLHEQGLPMETLERMVKKDETYFRLLLQLRRQPRPRGEAIVNKELQQFALRYVAEINRLHEEPDAVRFKVADGADTTQFLVLLTYAEEELFTSTFNGLLNRFLRHLEEKGESLDRALATIDRSHVRTFVKLCAGYNRLGDLYSQGDRQERLTALLGSFVTGVEKSPTPLEDAVTVADTFGMIKGPEVLSIMRETLSAEYERVSRIGHVEGTLLYGLLAGMFGRNTPMNDGWLEEMSAKYELPNLHRIESRELFGKDGANIQQYFFYGDEDGKANFESFVAEYRGKKDWTISDKGEFLHLTRVEEGRWIEIYANKPENEREGPERIAQILEQRKIASLVVVHRGHSYHVPKTIEHIPAIAKIVSLGSCGGYNNIGAVLERAPNAHIISTKGTGYRAVNEPLFSMLNDRIISGGPVEWEPFWEEARVRVGNNPGFKDYIAPHRNHGAMFIKAYNKRAEALGLPRRSLTRQPDAYGAGIM